MKRTLLYAAFALAGCAKGPDAVVPVAVPLAAYENLDCHQLAAEYLAEAEREAALRQAQQNAAAGDAIGVFLILVPVSSVFGGNKEGELAIAKGKVQAIESALLARGCERPALPAPPPPPPSTAAPT